MARRLLAISLAISLQGATARADDEPAEPTGVCVRGARTFTCPDGSTIDACDDCDGGGGGGSTGGGNAAVGVAKLVGVLAGVALFAPGFVVAPTVAIEVFWGAFGEHPLGDRDAQIAEAKAKWETFREEQRATEKRGHELNLARLEVDKSDLKDAVKQQDFPPLATPPPPRFWWQNMPRLVPNDDIACKAAGLEFPFRMLPGEKVGSFPDRITMMTTCASRIEKPVAHRGTDANGKCTNPGDLRCMSAGVCCPQGHGVYNAIDQMCYRDTDYRGSPLGDEAQRYLGGEYCPASSP